VKRTSLILVSVLVLAGILLSACGQAPSGTVKVATDATFPPFEIVDEKTNDLTGFDIELMKAIADKAGMKIEFVNTPFDSVIAGVTNCTYDMAIAAISASDERRAVMNFSEPYINAGQIVVIRKDETGITGKDDLAGKTVAAQLGTTGEIEAQKIPNVTYKPYDSYELAFLDLSNGQIDSVIADYPTALAYIAKNSEMLTTVGSVFTDESYAIAFCKSKTDLLEKVNTALKTVIGDGTVSALEMKWLAGQ
jgi:polar amino acid transport system substrate-binding protein